MPDIRHHPLFPIAFIGVMLMLASYFAIAAISGDYGIFSRAEVEAEARTLERSLASIEEDVAEMENLTRRLSDEFLDLDLLDSRARSVLGMTRADEIIVR